MEAPSFVLGVVLIGDVWFLSLIFGIRQKISPFGGGISFFSPSLLSFVGEESGR